MTSYAELGRQTEALAAFERCCALLAVFNPAPETCALSERLRQH